MSVWYLHIGHPVEENQQRVSISSIKQTYLKMNEEIRRITNEGKTAKNE